MKVKRINQFRQTTINLKEDVGQTSADTGHLKYTVYRCIVCAYLYAKENPPELCPICKAVSDMFEKFS